MTAQEVAKLIYIIRATYPNAFQRYTEDDMRNLIFSWASVMEDYSYEQASAGLKMFLASDTKGFPPSPGQVIDCIMRARGDDAMSATEAWALVRKAISNGLYGAEEEFAKLPPLCQKAIGSPENIREMAMTDMTTVAAVEQSHFIRAYNTVLQRERELAKIPASVLKAIEQAQREMLPA